jgi:tRNA dimethylallyltransferase
MVASVIHALVGPTASGKESTAVELASVAGAEILSLDSMKIYRGMDLGTAKASPAQRRRVPHHLVDLARPSDSFSTRRWLSAAESALTQIESRGARALFVGGTALYLKALLFGLFEGPSADPPLRSRLRALTGEELHRRLSEVDPETAAKVHPNDQRRLVRALEVYTITGRPVSELRREWSRGEPRSPAVLVGIRRPREDLYRRIDDRIDRMIEAGLVEEVRGLLDSAGGLGPVAGQALGYKEIAAWLRGDLPSLEEAVRLLRSRTRSFARRQLTWFKHFSVRWLDVAREEPPERTAHRARTALGW